MINSLAELYEWIDLHCSSSDEFDRIEFERNLKEGVEDDRTETTGM